jgi:hypothetical protein
MDSPAVRSAHPSSPVKPSLGKKWYAVTAFLLLLVVAQAVHWLITPRFNAGASTARWWAVVAQAVLGAAIAAWLFLRVKQNRH